MEGPDGDSQAGTIKVCKRCSGLRHLVCSVNYIKTACSTLKGDSGGALARLRTVICWKMTAGTAMLCCTCFKFQPLISKYFMNVNDDLISSFAPLFCFVLFCFVY
jgi:hypothetical protein